MANNDVDDSLVRACLEGALLLDVDIAGPSGTSSPSSPIVAHSQGIVQSPPQRTHVAVFSGVSALRFPPTPLPAAKAKGRRPVDGTEPASVRAPLPAIAGHAEQEKRIYARPQRSPPLQRQPRPPPETHESVGEVEGPRKFERKPLQVPLYLRMQREYQCQEQRQLRAAKAKLQAQQFQAIARLRSHAKRQQVPVVPSAKKERRRRRRPSKVKLQPQLLPKNNYLREGSLADNDHSSLNSASAEPTSSVAETKAKPGKRRSQPSTSVAVSNGAAATEAETAAYAVRARQIDMHIFNGSGLGPWTSDDG